MKQSVDRNVIQPGCFVLLRKELCETYGALVARVDRVRWTPTGGRVVVNRKYIPGRYVSVLRLGVNPFEVFLYGNLQDDDPTVSAGTTSIDIEDIVSVVDIIHTLPFAKPLLPPNLDKHYEDGTFSYESFCRHLNESDHQKTSMAIFYCRFMISRTTQKYHPGNDVYINYVGLILYRWSIQI